MTDKGAAGRSVTAGVAQGTELPALEVGPLTLSDFVRWAGYQENWMRVHYDAVFAREHAGLAGPIQSGHYRTALLTRMVTDWVGSAGWMRRLAVRHTGPVGCGDVVRCEGRVRQVRAADDHATTVEVDIWAVGRDGQRVSEGTASLEVRA